MRDPVRPELVVAVPEAYETPRVETVVTQEQLARQVHYAGESN